MEPRKIVAVALIIIGAVFYIQSNVYEASMGHGNDFAHLYLGARALKMHINPYDGMAIRKLAEQSGIPRMNPFVYPPLTAILFTPLASRTYGEAQFIWFLLNHLFLIGTFFLLIKIWGSRNSLMVAAFLAIVFAFFFPLKRTLTAGQLNALLLVLLSAAWFLEKRDWSVPAGALAGLAAIVKVYPGLFLLYYIGRGNWKAVVAMFLTMVILVGISVGVAGWKTNLDYFNVVSNMKYGSSTWQKYGEDFQTEPANQSISALLFRMCTVLRGTRGIVEAPNLALGLSYLAGISMLLVLLTYLIMSGGVPVDKGFNLTLLSALLIPSLMWDHYLLLALMPLVALGARIEQRGGAIRLTLWALCIALMAIPFNFWSDAFRQGLMIPVMSLKLYPMLLLYTMIWMMRSGGVQEEPEPHGVDHV